MTTSDLRTKSLKRLWPSAWRRSSVMPFLLRPITGHHTDGSPRGCGPQWRMGSPWPGASILMTSAPMSPSNWPQNGPAISVPSSSTRRSASAPDGESVHGGGVVRAAPGVGQAWMLNGIEFAPWNHPRIEIVEVGPRDGLQSESQVLPTAAKVEFIRRLVARRPAAHRGGELRESQARAADGGCRSGARGARAGERLRRAYIGLVLNRRGFERARAAGCTEVGMAIAASETLQPAKSGLQRRRGRRGLARHRQAARAAGIRAQITISTAFGCPFEGEVPAARVRALAERLAAGEPDEIAVADTIGVAVPTQVTELIGPLRASLPQRETARALPQHAQYRSRQCLRRGRSRRARARRELRRHRRLPVRARRHRQHSHRRSHLHAASHGLRHRRRPAGAARNQPLAAADSRPRRSRHVVKAGSVSGELHGNSIQDSQRRFRRWRSRLATRCPRARSRR